ncbi:hypothetical protein WOLCODRAFT_167762 [Wolfiporia cocos MD-104 SS10]|uniref:Metallo-beta-lactamase domain-containing protein n=1 Tax=Wolfiporia cocos (strain MD-104) TaxID=742152 RepID=A0A2H3J9T0_WOLCO|nr:hypothetical protein WOLCODRAFT_167762 [Wolfiporia cocos MD-104 SS10]
MPEEVESTSTSVASPQAAHPPLSPSMPQSTPCLIPCTPPPSIPYPVSPTDHVAGLLTLLRSVLGAAPSRASGGAAEPPRIEIFGPRGLRRLLRTQIVLTHTRSAKRYAVHELLAPGEAPSAPAEEEIPENEAPGLDIACNAAGFWRAIVRAHAFGNPRSAGVVVVDAGPIEHRDPCIGYVIREEPRDLSPATPVPRKIVILGDTSNPYALVPLIHPTLPTDNASGGSSDAPIEIPDEAPDAPAPTPTSAPTPVSLLVHEATDAFIPAHIDPEERTGRNRSPQIVHEKTIERGHSTPAMAGAFARTIGAERLVLNHIGSRFPAPAMPARSSMDRFRTQCMLEIQAQAQLTWMPANGAQVQAAYDYMRVVIPPNPSLSLETEDATGDVAHPDSMGGPGGENTGDAGKKRERLGEPADKVHRPRRRDRSSEDGGSWARLFKEMLKLMLADLGMYGGKNIDMNF